MQNTYRFPGVTKMHHHSAVIFVAAYILNVVSCNYSLEVVKSYEQLIEKSIKESKRYVPAKDNSRFKPKRNKIKGNYYNLFWAFN